MAPVTVMGQRFDGRGLPAGAEFRVSGPPPVGGSQYNCAVAYGRDGGFLVVWQTSTQVSSGIYSQAFDASGSPLGAEQRLTPNAGGHHTDPRAAPVKAGGFVVTWTCPASPDTDICAQRVSASGTPAGALFLVNSATAGFQTRPDVAGAGDAGVVFVWQTNPSGPYGDIVARRFDSALRPLGAEFAVHAPAGRQTTPTVAADSRNGFVVAWETTPNAGPPQVAARVFSGSAPAGPEFAVNTYAGYHLRPRAAVDHAGNVVVTWTDVLPSYDIHARRFSPAGTPRGAEFQATTYNSVQVRPVVASDPSGSFVLAWQDDYQDAGTAGIYARRYGGLRPHALEVAGGVNGIVESPSSFTARTAWRNDSTGTIAFQGHVDPVVPAGLQLTLDADTDYGSLAAGTSSSCVAPCYGASLSGLRPQGHVDLRYEETIVPDVQGQTHRWLLHVGGSFDDVLPGSPFYRFVETLIHRGVTAGCTGGAYCPAAAVTREQMAVFVLTAQGGSPPPPCGASPAFLDVPAASPFCAWIEELARRGVVGGCGGGNYCPSGAVSREQVAVFVLRTLDGSLDPPPCAPPNLFGDVPETSPFCRWVEELARRNVVGGCGGGNYCPAAPVTREQMSVFLAVPFGLSLYGP